MTLYPEMKTLIKMRFKDAIQAYLTFRRMLLILPKDKTFE